MKIIILGAGAIGSLYGAKLSKLNEVILVARKSHADKINKFGLQIKGVENKTYKLKAVSKINKIEENTLVILTTKVYDSEKALKSIKKLLRIDTLVLCLQNGYGAETIAKKIVSKKCSVLRGITAVGVSYLEAGKIKMNNVGYTAIEQSNKSEEIAKNFSECGLKGYVSENIKKDMWMKLILNCVLNPVTAILKIKNKEIADPSLTELRKEIVKECLAIAKKEKIDLTNKFVKDTIERIRRSDNWSSMYQDIFKDKKTEIDYLNGAIVRLGKRYKIKTPVNESLVGMIKFLESKKPN